MKVGPGARGTGCQLFVREALKRCGEGNEREGVRCVGVGVVAGQHGSQSSHSVIQRGRQIARRGPGAHCELGALSAHGPRPQLCESHGQFTFPEIQGVRAQCVDREPHHSPQIHTPTTSQQHIYLASLQRVVGATAHWDWLTLLLGSACCKSRLTKACIFLCAS